MPGAGEAVEWKPFLREIDQQPGHVHVWRANLAPSEPVLAQCRKLLPPGELQRASRFYFEKDRKRHIVSHAMMREVLGLCIGVGPREIDFDLGAQGKPDLPAAVNPAGLKFNLSHSGELALLALTVNQTVGVDVELIRLDFGGQHIAERFFSASETLKLLALPVEQQAESFFKCWTRKEAYIKAKGGGLSIPLDSFDVAFTPGEKPEILRVAGNPQEPSQWTLYDLDPGVGYAGALLVDGHDHHVHCWHWEPGGEIRPIVTAQ